MTIDEWHVRNYDREKKMLLDLNHFKVTPRPAVDWPGPVNESPFVALG